MPPMTPEDPTDPPVNPDGDGDGGDGPVVVVSDPDVVVSDPDGDGDGGDGSVVVISDPDVVVSDPEDDPVVQEEQFYVANKNCYSTLNSNGLVTSGELYSSKFQCCNSLPVQADRMPCVRSTETTPPNPNPAAKSSASQLTRGSYVIAAAVCLCFHFM